MARGLTSAVNTELATDSLNPVTLVYLGVSNPHGCPIPEHHNQLVHKEGQNRYLICLPQ